MVVCAQSYVITAHSAYNLYFIVLSCSAYTLFKSNSNPIRTELPDYTTG